MSSVICNLTPSSKPKVSFKHISFNVKIQFPFKSAKFIGMIAGGTGITPMIQALHACLGADEDAPEKVSLLYGSRSSDDILGEALLDKWSDDNEKFDLTYVLMNESKDSLWNKGRRGCVNRELIQEKFPDPSNGKDVLIFVCGPPAFDKAIAGPR